MFSKIICTFALKVEKINILIIYAPRKVRERSERNPKGKIGGACSGLISPKVEKINILIIYAARKVRERSERNPKGKFKTNKYERIRRRRGKTS